MAKVEGITIGFEFDSKSKLKLRAIAKHAEALADELDAIDNKWECPRCGESNYNDYFAGNSFKHRLCKGCNRSYTVEDFLADELPTRLEGSD
ncbi:hypothetical protein ABNX05_04920 [Lysinibacillus sp. M3]|uniref:Transposase zinc-ribbon domain-containing protein n=1 Tax=Lysinibacillus zambalensis TaxID=3160866 RepID=A0ABV1MN54_9BACI